MKTLGLMVAVTMLVVGMAPLALANDAEKTATGEGTAGNVAPTVPSAEPSPDNTVAPQSTHFFNCTVKDNNTLADIENVQLILYTTDAGVDGENHVENHYVFWFDPSDNSWHSVLGADYIGEGSTYPADLSVQSDNYNFAVKLSGSAKAGTDWNAKWIAVDDNAASGDNSATFEVLEYISLEISPNTQTFSGDPGDTGLTAIPEGAITCTVSSGTNFDIETKLLADWSGTTYGGTIGADNTHALGEVSVDLSLIYQNVWTDETLGEDVTKEITYTLDLPVPLRDDVYTATIYINAKKHV